MRLEDALVGGERVLLRRIDTGVARRAGSATASAGARVGAGVDAGVGVGGDGRVGGRRAAALLVDDRVHCRLRLLVDAVQHGRGPVDELHCARARCSGSAASRRLLGGRCRTSPSTERRSARTSTSARPRVSCRHRCAVTESSTVESNDSRESGL